MDRPPAGSLRAVIADVRRGSLCCTWRIRSIAHQLHITRDTAHDILKRIAPASPAGLRELRVDAELPTASVMAEAGLPSDPRVWPKSAVEFRLPTGSIR